MSGFHFNGKRVWVIGLVALLSFFVVQNALAKDDYPNRPIELVLPVSAGGGFDLTARVVISVAKDYFGVPMTVTLKPGAGTVTGTKFVASSRPDGYTLMAGGEHAIVLGQFEKIPVDVLRDLIPVCRISSWPWVLVVPGPKSPKPSSIKTAQEFFDYAKKHPGMTLGNSGALTVAHLPALQLEIQGGMSFTHMPYNGGGPLRQAVIAGEVPAAIGPSVWAAQDHVDGLVRALALTGDERHPLMPDVPTFRELGYEIDTMLTFGIFAPKGTPEDRLAFIENGFAKLVKDKSVNGLVKKMGERLSWKNRKDFTQLMVKTEEAAKQAAKVLNK